MKTRTQTGFAKKWVGVCDVMVRGPKVRLTSLYVRDGKAVPFPNGELTMTVNLSDLPRAAQRVIKPEMKDSKKFRVRLTEDGDAVDGVTPVNGVWGPAKLVGLGPKSKDGTYSLIHKTFNAGKEDENSHDEFIAIYELSEGPFRGVELPGYYLHYKFEEVPEGEEDEGFTRFNTADTPQAARLHQLQAWAEIHGNVLDEPIRWPDDGIILETIEERALEADREVNLIFENGWIKSVQGIETYDDEDVTDEEIDEAFPEVVEVPAKKSAVAAAKDGAKKVAEKVVGKAPVAKKSPAKNAVEQDDDEDL